MKSMLILQRQALNSCRLLVQLNSALLYIHITIQILIKSCHKYYSTRCLPLDFFSPKVTNNLCGVVKVPTFGHLTSEMLMHSDFQRSGAWQTVKIRFFDGVIIKYPKWLVLKILPTHTWACACTHTHTGVCHYSLSFLYYI